MPLIYFPCMQMFAVKMENEGGHPDQQNVSLSLPTLPPHLWSVCVFLWRKKNSCMTSGLEVITAEGYFDIFNSCLCLSLGANTTDTNLDPDPLSETLAEIVASQCSASLGTEDQENPRVVNVILPDHRGYFVHHLGYFLATFLLLAFVVFALIMLIRRHKKRGVYLYNLPLCFSLFRSFIIILSQVFDILPFFRTGV